MENSVMIDLGEQRRNSAIHIHESILPQTPLPSRRPHDIEQSSLLDFPAGSDSKESACNAGGPSSIPGSGRSPGEGNSNPLQYFCLGNPTDGGAWLGYKSVGSQRVRHGLAIEQHTVGPCW